MAKRGTSGIHCLIAVDKPQGCTSHDVVARVRRALGERRVGHAGTLDPAATGVMILGIGQATRLLGKLTLDTKSYVARIAFGAETSTDDAEGEVIREEPVPEELLDERFARAALERFRGDSLQVPPSFSAISVNGVRAYKAARAGESVELAARPVTVHSAELLEAGSVDGRTVWTVAFTVSKGTYIRALARDIGRAVGSAAHLEGLRRTASGSVGLARCCALEGLSPEKVAESMLDPVSCLGVPRIDLSREFLDDIRCGRAIPRRRVACALGADSSEEGVGGPVALVVDGALAALALATPDRILMKDVFPDGIKGVA